MPTYIIKHTMPNDGEERCLLWSSIVDAPTSYGVTIDEIRDWWREEYGRSGLERLDAELARPTSGRVTTLSDVWVTNRAGAGETRLSIEQIVDYYFVRKGEGERPVGESWKDIHAE